VRSPRRPVAAAVLTAALLAACSGSDSGPRQPAERSATTADPGTPVTGGTLRLGLVAPASLEPGKANPGSHSELLIADLLYDGLTTMGGDGVALPAIAASWTASPDQKVWWFTLAPGRSFDGGRAITAADVKYSLERVARQGDASFNAARLEDIVGYSAFVSGQAGDLLGLKVLDDHSLEIGLTAPMAMLPTLLAGPTFGIVAKEAVEASGAMPITSSGLAVQAADAKHVVLERPAAVTGYLDTVELVFFDDEAAAYGALDDGDVDWATVPADQLGDARKKYGDDGIATFHAELFFGLNLQHPKFADLRFRQAIVKAIDRKAIVKAVYADVADPLGALVPAGIVGHVDDACGEPCSYDPARSRQLVTEVFGAIPVTEVFIDYDESATQRSVAGVVEQQLEAVGIPATQRPRPFEEYQRFAASGEQELFAFGWIGLYDSPDAYLSPLFRTGTRDNVTGFSDGAVDLLLASARAQADVAVRADQYRQAEAAILHLAPIVPLAQFRTQVAFAARVHGMTLDSDGTFDLTKVWLAKS
jgi:ABC-type transport system substrate-binding protein